MQDSSIRSRRAVVTGGAGFIGSHLVERLLHDGHDVLVADNFSTGRPKNLAHLNAHPRLKVQEVNVSDFDEIRRVVEGAEWVFHLAALADIIPSIQRPLDYYRTNVAGTACVLEAARLAGIRRFLYAASSSCYGVPDSFPTPESAAIRPEYPYALTKYLGEQTVMHWTHIYKLPSISLRLFNVFGPRSRTSGTYGAVFGVFLAQKLADRPLTVVGDGTQTRDFTFVTDVVDAFIKAAESDMSGETFNVGSGGTYSVNRVVDLVGGPVVHIPKRPGEPDCTFADTRKIQAALSWSPQVSFDDGVRILLKNIDDWQEAPVWDPKSIEDVTQEWFAYLGR